MPHSARYPLHIIESTKEINSACLIVQDIHYILLKAPENKFCMP
jgi:hypothetical protein